MTLIPILDDAVKQAWDYVGLTQDSTTDTYVLKIGGQTIATIVITYTDSGKGTIDHVTRS